MSAPALNPYPRAIMMKWAGTYVCCGSARAIHPRSARDRAIKSYLDDGEDDDDEEEAELSEEGPRARRVDHYELAADKEEVANSPGKWSCNACTMLNERISQRCRICGSSRNHKPSPPRSGVAQGTASPEKQHDAAGASADAARPSAGGADGSDGEDGGEDPAFVKECKTLVKKLWAHEFGKDFRYDVTELIAPGYTSVVAQPMSLKSLVKNVKKGKYKASYSVSRVTDFDMIVAHYLLYLFLDAPLSVISQCSIHALCTTGIPPRREPHLRQRREVQWPAPRDYQDGTRSQGYSEELGR